MVLLALALDLMFNDPPNKFHPTAWLGKIIALMVPHLKSKSQQVEKINGVFLALTAILIYVLPIYMLVKLSSYSLILELVISAALLKLTFALKCMSKHVNPSIRQLANGDLESARRTISLIVRRDVSRLDEHLLASAAIESTAESIVDGFSSPLFYFSLFGVIGAAAYRAINTLDSMVGYRDPYFMNIGWFSAKLDTLANWISARLAAIMIILSSLLLRLDWKSSLKIALRDHRKTESLNAGWVMAAMAGALRVRLEKPGHYTLGEEFFLPSYRDITLSLKIMYLASLLFMITICFPLSILFSLVWEVLTCV